MNIRKAVAVVVDAVDAVAGIRAFDNTRIHACIPVVAVPHTGRPIVSVLIESLKGDDAGFEQLIEKRTSFSDRVVECRLGNDEVKRWFSCSGVWFYERSTKVDDFFTVQDVPYLMLTVHEITTLKHQQEEIKYNAMRALVAEESLNAGMRETLSAATYKLQEPLNLLRAALAMLERRSDSGEQSAIIELLQQVSEKGEESLELLQKIMPEAHDGENELLNINQVIHEVLSLATPRLLAEGITVSWKPESRLPSINGNVRQMRVLFRHLIDNAIEAISEAGGKKREIELQTSLDNNWLDITITDTGGGIDVSEHYRVFEPFYTTKRGQERAHTGIGLTLAQEAVNAHAGTIEIDSSYSGGCRVKLRFPITRH